MNHKSQRFFAFYRTIILMPLRKSTKFIPVIFHTVLLCRLLLLVLLLARSTGDKQDGHLDRSVSCVASRSILSLCRYLPLYLRLHFVLNFCLPHKTKSFPFYVDLILSLIVLLLVSHCQASSQLS
jgi:hypothetical protein